VAGDGFRKGQGRGVGDKKRGEESVTMGHSSQTRKKENGWGTVLAVISNRLEGEDSSDWKEKGE